MTIGLRGKATAMPVRMSMSCRCGDGQRRAREVGRAPGLGDDQPRQAGLGGRRPTSPAWRKGCAGSMASKHRPASDWCRHRRRRRRRRRRRGVASTVTSGFLGHLSTSTILADPAHQLVRARRLDPRREVEVVVGRGLGPLVEVVRLRRHEAAVHVAHLGHHLGVGEGRWPLPSRNRRRARIP